MKGFHFISYYKIKNVNSKQKTLPPNREKGPITSKEEHMRMATKFISNSGS